MRSPTATVPINLQTRACMYVDAVTVYNSTAPLLEKVSRTEWRWIDSSNLRSEMKCRAISICLHLRLCKRPALQFATFEINKIAVGLY